MIRANTLETIEMDDDMTFDEESFVANVDNLVVNEEEKQFGSHTIHRRTLDHISQDEALSKCYTVPNLKTTDVKNLAANARQMMERQVCGKTKSEWIGTLIPCYNWLCVYDWRSILITDILAGIAVGVMAVPQSMSYAKLAGLPVEYGLYSALFPIWAYAIFGTSRQLAVGPVSLVSLMLGSGLSNQMAKLGISSDDANYTEVLTTLAIQTSFVVGLLNIGMGLFRLGFVTVFLSHAVISGFISGAALISGMSQLKHILGIKANGDNVEKIIESICENIGGFNYKSFLMGSFSLVALLLIKPLSKKFPNQKWLKAIGPIFITVVTIAITWGFNLDKQGLPIIASIPAGFPNFTAGLWFPMDKFGDMITTAVSITIIGFMESIVIAKSLAAKHNYEVDSSMELIGLGMSNFIGSMFQAYPSAGSFSRSAVNNDSGAQSGVSGIVTALLVGLVLLFLTDVFEYLPLSVLAAVVISGVINLLDYNEAIYLWKVHKFDFAVWMSAFFGVTLLGVETGLALSVVISLLLIIYESAFPHIAVLGRLPGSAAYRDIKQYPKAEQYDGIVIVKIDAPIYFANIDNIRSKLQKYEKNASKDLLVQNGGDVRFVILEMSPNSHIDSSALHVLNDMLKIYKSRGVQLVLANPNVKVMEKLVASKLIEEVGQDHVFVSIQDAVKWCLDHLDTLLIFANETIEEDIEGASQYSC